jgi:thioredoxin reductase (NADPH)
MILDLVIVGAGPAGLAAAIAARRLGLTYVVLEKGALVNSLLHYPTDMVFFTTPELLEIGGLPFVSPYDKPTRQEALRYYRRVTDTFELDVRLGERVTSLRRAADGTFTVTSQPANGEACTRQSRTVVLATGAYDVANPLGVPGEDLPHVSHYYREPHSCYRRRVVIVGGKNSAAEAALELYRAGAHVLIVHRGTALAESIKYWVKPDIENRIKEGAIRARFSTRVVEITPEDVVLEGPDGRVREPADAVLLLTGYTADTTLLRSAGAAIDHTELAPVHDPETYETTVPNLFVIGACVAGRQSGRIFIENGRFHGEVVVRTIAERMTGQRAEGSGRAEGKGQRAKGTERAKGKGN